MEYADRVEIATPEGVDVSLELAGLGSRFIAILIDTAFKLLLIGALFVVLHAIGGGGAVAALVIGAFLIWFFYDVLFEVLAGGRTPGKRASGIRVIGAGGEPVTLLPSSTRNLIRLVDGPLTGFIAGVVSIVASKRNQRLGDMAADTLVVRDAPPGAGSQAAGRTQLPAAHDPHWDVSAVSAEELSAVRQYLDRRWSLEAAARERLAWQLAEGLRAKVAGAPTELRGEEFLERLAAAKAARG